MRAHTLHLRLPVGVQVEQRGDSSVRHRSRRVCVPHVARAAARVAGKLEAAAARHVKPAASRRTHAEALQSLRGAAHQCARCCLQLLLPAAACRRCIGASAHPCAASCGRSDATIASRSASRVCPAVRSSPSPAQLVTSPRWSDACHVPPDLLLPMPGRRPCAASHASTAAAAACAFVCLLSSSCCCCCCYCREAAAHLGPCWAQHAVQHARAAAQRRQAQLPARQRGRPRLLASGRRAAAGMGAAGCWALAGVSSGGRWRRRQRAEDAALDCVGQPCQRCQVELHVELCA